MPRILFLGVAVLDQIYRVPRLPGEPVKMHTLDYTEVGGGMAATGAVAATKLGAQATLLTRVGDDAVGDTIVAELAGYGVDVGHVRRLPNQRSIRATVLIDDAGERAIIAYAPKLDPDPGWLPLDLVARVDAVMVDQYWIEGSLAVLEAAARRAIPAVLDFDLSLDPRATDLIALASHAVFSEQGLRAWSGNDDIDAGLAQAAEQTTGLVGVTTGARGVSWWDDGTIRRMAPPPVEAVDTLGAGDVFHGALACALAEGMADAAALRFANAAAALKCTRPGGRAGVATRAEVDAVVAQDWG